MPWVCLTRSATAICSERDAPSGLPLPPLAAQVDGVNCRPPEKPLPVLVPQLPPDSHRATASQSVADAVPAVAIRPVEPAARASATAPARFVVRRRVEVMKRKTSHALQGSCRGWAGG